MKVLRDIGDLQSRTTARDLTKLRESVTAVADAGRTAVEVVRESFGAGVAPFTTVGSGSVANYLETFTEDKLGTKLVKDTSRFGLMTAPGGTGTPMPRPELDSVSIVEDKHRGVLDQFTAQLTISLLRSDVSRTDKIRIYRSYVGKSKVPRAGFAALMDSPSGRSKGSDTLMPNALRAADLGVGNMLTTFIGDDPGSPTRSVTSPAERELSPTVPPLNTNKNTEYVGGGLLSIQGADRSVVENLSFYLNRRMVGDLVAPAERPLTVGSKSGINVLRGRRVANAGDIIQANNGAEFIGIGTVSPQSAGTRVVGDIVEIGFVDPNVVFGAKYTYFVVAIGQHGEQGPRSRMVEVTVSRTVPPSAPTVTYGLTGGVPRFAIRCTPGTSHVEVYRSGRAALMSSIMGSDESLIIEGPSNKVGEFYHAGDLGLGPDGSTTFVDRDIVPGDRPTYRFYSVDPYGLKCQTPFSCSLRLPSHGDPLPFSIPSITTEQVTAGKNVVRVSVSADDPRVVGFLFSRRDITVNERAVHQANQPEYFTLGRTDAKRAGSRRGPMPLDQDWPSVMMAVSGSASFFDTSVRLDRVYQYAVQAIDRRGNKSFVVGAQPLGVYSKPTVDAPTDLSAKVVVDSGKPQSVMLSWTPGTVDFSPNHLLDDQDVLAATSVRSVFQVERRQKGAPFWDAMPATTESYFIDPCISDQVPTSRPPYVVQGLEYEYRVLAMQSGGFVSPRTDKIDVTVAPPPAAPDVLWIRTGNIAVRPLNVVVSWTMSADFVHHWEVQRAVTNKLYGSRIGSMDSTLAQQLQYVTVASVTPEASRASGIKADVLRLVNPELYVGNRFYIDPDINPANSYFYRVRSVGKLGISSDWSYGGVSVTDHAFDKKFLSTLSDDKKVSLATDIRAISNDLRRKL